MSGGMQGRQNYGASYNQQGGQPAWLSGLMNQFQRPGMYSIQPRQRSNPYWQPQPVQMPQAPAQAPLGGGPLTAPVMMAQQLAQAQQQVQAYQDQPQNQPQGPYMGYDTASGGW